MTRKGPLSPSKLWLRRFKAAQQRKDVAAQDALAQTLLTDPALSKWWPDGLLSLGVRTLDIDLVQQGLRLGHRPGADTLAHFFLADPGRVDKITHWPHQDSQAPAVSPRGLACWEALAPYLNAETAVRAWCKNEKDRPGVLWKHTHPRRLLDLSPGVDMNAAYAWDATQPAATSSLLLQAWTGATDRGAAMAMAALDRGADPFLPNPGTQAQGWSLAEALVRAIDSFEPPSWSERLEQAPAWRAVKARVVELALTQSLPAPLVRPRSRM